MHISYYKISRWLLTFILIIPFGSYSQEKGPLKISGQILDKNDQPIPGVNIFISGTTIGAASDKFGQFHFKAANLKNGQYKLVFRNIAYHTNTYAFKLPVKGNNLQLKVYLKERSILLDSIVVTAESTRNLEKFREVFLGGSKNGRAASLINPEILHFKRKKNQLFAQSEQTLRLDNTRLGYTMYMILDVFAWHLKEDRGKYFFKDIWFVEQKPANEQEQTMWQENRLRTYMNSSKRFFNILNNDGDLREHGYKITLGHIEKRAFRPMITKSELKKLGVKKVTASVYRDVYLYKLDKKKNYSVNVVYKGNRSVIRAVKKQPVMVDKNGNIVNTPEVSFSGFWSKQRTADMLPFDYRPTVDTTLIR